MFEAWSLKKMRQLIFTSALAGLAPGRSGFCTVARHASLRARTVAELERMSEYKPPAGTRPTIFLYRVYSGGNEPLYILTRAGDAGTDDFGRPNFIVHHLIFRKAELPQLLPPAEVALRFRGWCKKYEGAPQFLPEDESLPPEILRVEGESLLPAKRWEELTGDAGNAALLCPHGDARATAFLGDEFFTETVLGLFAESAETLGGENAWNLAFSTGICAESGPGRFLWRMVSEREIGVCRPGDFVLDFLAPLEFLRAPKTKFAEYARSGIFPEAFPVSSEGASADEISNEEEPVFPALIVPEMSAEPAGTSSGDEPPPGTAHKRFADIAGTAKFLGISAVVVALVVACVVFFGAKPEARRGGNGTSEISATEASVGAFRKTLDEKIKKEDFVGAAETWCAFSDSFSDEAARLRSSYLPRFKLKVADAYAARLAERMSPLELGGQLSVAEKQLLAGELAMFKRICRELGLTPQRLQKRNLAIIERAEAVLADGN